LLALIPLSWVRVVRLVLPMLTVRVVRLALSILSLRQVVVSVPVKTVRAGLVVLAVVLSVQALPVKDSRVGVPLVLAHLVPVAVVVAQVKPVRMPRPLTVAMVAMVSHRQLQVLLLLVPVVVVVESFLQRPAREALAAEGQEPQARTQAQQGV
jgi:hypothetical protein